MKIGLQIILGFILADWTTGFFHWFEDTYLDYCTNTPFLSSIAKNNEIHHYYPRNIFSYSFLDNIIVSGTLTTIIFCMLFLINKKMFVKYLYLLSTFYIFNVMGPIIHRFCHYRDCENNYVIKVLQSIGIICTHEHHKLHHLTSDKHYCVITPYSNYLFDGIHLWRSLEYIIYQLTNIKPSKKISYDKYKSIHTELHKNKLACPPVATKEELHQLKIKLDEYKKC